jgi:hypothetical protein
MHILHGGDGVLRMALFWSIFVPLGEYFSVDARRAGPARPAPRYLSVGTVAFIGQIILIYWFAAMYKGTLIGHIAERSHPWYRDGIALGNALHLDAFSTSFGIWLRQYEGLMRFLTFASLYLEAIGPALLLLPFGTDHLRFAVVVAFVGFHLGIALTMAIGIFPWVCIAYWLALLPPWFWDRLLPRFRARLPRVPQRAAPPQPGAVAAALCAFLFTYCVMLNVSDLDDPTRPNDPFWGRYFPPRVGSLRDTLGLGQGWGMFAPEPSKYSGWWVFRGELTDGQEVDLLTGAPLPAGGPASWPRPALVSEQYGNTRWRRFRMNLYEASGSFFLRHTYAEYLAREHERDHPGQKVRLVEFHFFAERSSPPLYARDVAAHHSEVLYSQTIGAGPAWCGRTIWVGDDGEVHYSTPPERMRLADE